MAGTQANAAAASAHVAEPGPGAALMSAEGGISTGAALAALAICESLLIALIEAGLLDEAEREEILEAALEAHRASPAGRYSKSDHDEAAEIIRRMLVRSDSTRS